MKAFISVDLEGLPYVVIPGHLNLKGTLYQEAREIATKITLIVARELKEQGFDQVVIASFMLECVFKKRSISRTDKKNPSIEEFLSV